MGRRNKKGVKGKSQGDRGGTKRNKTSKGKIRKWKEKKRKEWKPAENRRGKIRNLEK